MLPYETLQLFVLLIYVQIMVPFAYTEFIGNLTNMVKSGAIPMSRIDDAVTRILRVKFHMGLFESPYADMKLQYSVGQTVRILHLQVCLSSLLVCYLVTLKLGAPNKMKPFISLTVEYIMNYIRSERNFNEGFNCVHDSLCVGKQYRHTGN